jgi:hypothetical protein
MEASVFYRMSRLHFDDDRFSELLEWAESIRPKVQQIEGLVFADIARTGSGEGMVIAGYESEADFDAVRDEVSGIIDEMVEYLTDRPHTHAGSSEFSFKGQLA